MNFEISNGTGVISIRNCGLGVYFFAQKPLATVWYDCAGSVGKYLTLLEYDQPYRAHIQANINAALLATDAKDTTLSEWMDILAPLWGLFPNGSYSLAAYQSGQNTFYQYESYYGGDKQPTIRMLDSYVVYGNPQKAEKYADLEKQYNQYLNAQKNNPNSYTQSLVSYCTSGFYDGGSRCFIATQPESELSAERVKYYEERMLKGDRPFAIICTPCGNDLTEDVMYDTYFILDGHHKLAAYANLKIEPSVLLITHMLPNEEGFAVDLEPLLEVLYPCQIEHLLENWDEKEAYLIKISENPNHPLLKFVKNGLRHTYHPNGQLAHEGYYIHDVLEGTARWWYENGQLQQIQHWKHNKRIGLWQQWFASGSLRFVQPFDEAGQITGKMVSYYENGQVFWEQSQQGGKSLDGNSYSVWYENGEKQSELCYKNGLTVEHKNYDAQGKLIHWEKADPITGRLVKQQIKK